MEGKEHRNKGWGGMREVHTHTYKCTHTNHRSRSTVHTPFSTQCANYFYFILHNLNTIINTLDLHKMNTLMSRWLVCNYGNRMTIPILAIQLYRNQEREREGVRE